MQHENGGSRRVDLGDETLLLDADAGRVVRLRGAARAAIDGADTPEARAAIGHLVGLGVLDEDADSFVGVASDVTRRDVLSVSAAAALGVTVMALPTAAAAVSLGGSGSTQRTGFVQVNELDADEIVPDSTSLFFTRSFVYGGFIHLLDLSSWLLYLIPTTLNLSGTRAVDLSDEIPEENGDYRYWSESNPATDFVVDGGYAYIATTYDAPFPDYFLRVVRLALPIAVDITSEGAVTVWTTPLANGTGSGREKKDLAGASWNFPNAGVILGSNLVDPGPFGSYSESRFTDPVAFDQLYDPIRALVLQDGFLYGVLHFVDGTRSTGLTVVEGSLGTEDATFVGDFSVKFFELVRIPTSGAGAGVPVFKDLGSWAELLPDGGGSGDEEYAEGNLNLHRPSHMAVGVGSAGSAQLLFFGESLTGTRNTAIRVSTPAGETPTAVELPGLWPDVDWELTRYVPNWVRIGTYGFVGAEIEEGDDEESESGTGLLRVDLSDPTQTQFFPIDADLDPYGPGPVTTDGTYIFVTFDGYDSGEDESFLGVARFEIGTGSALTYDGAAVIGQDSFSSSHDPLTAQPWGSGISGVLTAGNGAVPIAIFREVTPS